VQIVAIIAMLEMEEASRFRAPTKNESTVRWSRRIEYISRLPRITRIRQTRDFAKSSRKLQESPHDLRWKVLGAVDALNGAIEQRRS
jgi:hypothetical protein